jgi:hypothetical protein
MGRRTFTLNEFIEKAQKIHGTKYDYFLVSYKNNKSKIKIICKIHKEFEQVAGEHIRGHGCRKCSTSYTKINKEEFLKRAKETHGSRYDYSKVIYTDFSSKIEIVCPDHGSFWQTPIIHSRGSNGSGSGCQICANNVADFKSFEKKAKKVHNDIFDYSKVNYINSKTKIEIICKIHGSFWQTPSNHIFGSGCIECMADSYRMDIKEFIEKAKKIHNNKYDYSKAEYNGSVANIDIICPHHGLFRQVAGTHLSNHGCPKCFVNKSKKSQKWLDKLGIPKSFREHSIRTRDGRFVVDGFNPKTKTIYEFYGDFWHGNPKIYDQNKINKVSNKKFGDLYKATILKEEVLKNNGYKIISIWENEFIEG